MKIFKCLSNSKNMVFDVNKLLNVSEGLTLTVLADLHCRRMVFAGECVNTDISQELLRQDVVLRG